MAHICWEWPLWVVCTNLVEHAFGGGGAEPRFFDDLRREAGKQSFKASVVQSTPAASHMHAYPTQNACRNSGHVQIRLGEAEDNMRS